MPNGGASNHQNKINNETVGSLIRIGGVIGAMLQGFRRFALPSIAVGQKDLYRVLVMGTGFELPVEGTNEKPIGSFTTRFVPARSRLEAEALAKSCVLREWQGLSLFSHFTGIEEPLLSVCESEAIQGWLCRKGQGFTFYCADESPNFIEK